MKLLSLLRYHGMAGFAAKAWEKVMVDRRRFRGGNLGTGMDVPAYRQEDPPLPPDDGRPLTILYLVHYFFPEKSGGTERFVLTQALEQKRKGRAVHIVTLSVSTQCENWEKTGGILWKDYEYQGIPVTAFRYEKTPMGVYYKRIEEDDPPMECFARLMLERVRPSVVHCAYGQPMAAFLKVCRQREIPYLMTLTGFDSICHYTTMLDKQGQLCPGSCGGRRCEQVCRTFGVKDYEKRYESARRYLQGASAVTAPSGFVSQVIAQEFPGQYVRVIPHGISGGGFVERHGPVRRFAFVGTFTELKGMHLLLDAFCTLPGDVQLHLYGTGSERYIAQLKRSSAHDPRIVWEGERAPGQIGEAYAWADCVVIPSLVPETYNYVIREALSYGCIVVASKIGALPEVVLQGENGFLADPGDKDSLKEALQAAMGFSWERYRTVPLPSPEDETKAYGALYALVSKGGKDG